MKVLALDTTLTRCSVAFAAHGAVLAGQSQYMQRGHAERIAPMAEEVMRQAGADFRELDRIVVTTGPGSFTGLRVGLAFARALAVALAKPCVGVSTLEALALEAGEAGRRGAALALGADLCFASFLDGAPYIAPARGPVEAAKAALHNSEVRGPAAALFRGNTVDAPQIEALALRGALLSPARYRPDPLYLRAPHVTPARR